MDAHECSNIPIKCRNVYGGKRVSLRVAQTVFYALQFQTAE